MQGQPETQGISNNTVPAEVSSFVLLGQRVEIAQQPLCRFMTDIEILFEHVLCASRANVGMVQVQQEFCGPTVDQQSRDDCLWLGSVLFLQTNIPVSSPGVYLSVQGVDDP